MAQPQIDPRTSGEVLLDENSFTLGELPSHPLAAVFIPLFDAFQAKLFTVMTARMMLVIAVGKSSGAVFGADDGIDDFLDLLDRTLLILTKNDREARLYLFYFGKMPVHLLKRPILGEELVTVKGFLSSLQTSAQPALAALAPRLDKLIVKADAAVAQQLAASHALKDFDMLGPMKALIDEYNALRQTVYGKLAAIPHEHPDEMLPTSFADRFFRHETNKGITALRNPDEVQVRIDAMMKKVGVATKHRDELLAEAARKAADKQDLLNILAALEESKKEKEASEEKLKKLQKEVEAAKKKSKKK
jgi:hypothetical protein